MDFKKFLEMTAEADLLEAKKKKESTAEKDEKAEKAGKKVAKDIEYDEGHKGKDDDKAEKAGKKVTKDIEYDDKKDKKKKSLKDWFEMLDKELISENTMAPGQGKPVAILDPKKQHQGAGVITSTDPELAGMLKNLDPKKVQVVMTAQANKPGTTQPTTTTTTAQPQNQAGGTTVQEEEKWIQKATEKGKGKFAAKAKAAGMSTAAFAKSKADAPGKLGKQARLAMTLSKLRKKKANEAEIPQDGAQSSPLSHVVREAAKPDYIDLDKDGNKKESMKKAAHDAKKKKKVKESMNTIEAAYHEGKSHGLSKHGYSCRYNEGSDEHKNYHKGFVEGLDECYGMSQGMGIRNKPILGMQETVPATVPGMANAALPPTMEADVGEGNLFTGNLAKARAAGKTMADLDGDGDMEKVQKESIFAFEDFDKQLNELLKEDSQIISEGLSVSMSTGQQGTPDSVSVTATDDDSTKLLDFIKQVGLGGMGGAPEAAGTPAEVVTVSDYGAPKFGGHDNSDMKALLQKVGVGSEDYKDEEGHEHDHAQPCNECGMMEAECGCEKKVDEVETMDQATYEVAEDNSTDGDSGDSGQIEMGKSEAEEDMALAKDNQQAKTVTTNEGGDGGEASEESDKETAGDAGEGGAADVDDEQEKLKEWANNVGEKGTDTAFEEDIEFMTKIISGGLNKPKSTGQTTIPVIAGQNARTGDEDVLAWKKLAGLVK